MDSSASVGVLFVMLHAITSLLLFLVCSVYADQSPALQRPDFCSGQGRITLCILPVQYPLEIPDYSDKNCGYPGFKVDCDPNKYEGKPFMNISNHIYQVRDVDYGSKVITLVDIDVGKSRGGCPQPKRNFSFPSSPSWVNYDLSTNEGNITFFYNCSSVPDSEIQYCSQNDAATAQNDTTTTNFYVFNSYEFRNREVSEFDWYGNCAQNVVIPFNGNGVYNYYTHPIELEFYMRWSATDWCEDCERSGGHCWSIYNSTGCACGKGNSYDRTCPVLTPPTHQGVPPTPSIASKSQHRKDGLSIGLKIGIGVLSGCGVVLLALLVFLKWFNHSYLSISPWRNKNKSPVNIEVFLEKYGCLALQRYKYSEIKKMTNSFKDTLGQGGFGRVFKGELHDGRLVAVKQLNESKGDGEDFINEVATIGRTNHVNVVNLVGFCIEGTHRALVYEFMPNGSLERFIYTRKESSTTLSLGWEKLYQIALGIARGLDYLHRGCNTRILHFDIKPHNILLDQNFCPKISDFGLAKLYPSRESVVSTVGARGTMGYIAPELCYKTFGNVSHKSDVYSYGMMMLEMIGGRKNIDATVDNISEIYFPLWIYNHLKRCYEAKGLEEIQARELFEDEKAKKMVLVALWCIQAHPVDRPSMSKVVEMLEGNTHELQMPPNPSVDPRSGSSTSS